VNEMKSW